MKSIKKNALAWLLHQANRGSCSPEYYKIKTKLLRKFGSPAGFDLQFIEGKKCWSCGGTGIHNKYDWRTGRIYDRDECWSCSGTGYYKFPVWNTLQRFDFGKYTFHQPIGRTYFKKPNVISDGIILGFIEHQSSDYSEFAGTVLFLIYDKDFIKRWWSQAGWGWRIRWWIPKNYLHNAIHLIKYGPRHIRFSPPFARIRRKPNGKPLQELIDSGEIKNIIEGRDEIENPLPVFTVRDGKLVKSFTDQYGWPNITDDGYIMYENTHFKTEIEAINYGISEYEAGAKMFSAPLTKGERN